MHFILSLMFSLQQNWRTRGRNRFCQSGWGGSRAGGGVGVEVAQTMYTQVNKCKKEIQNLKKGQKMRQTSEYFTKCYQLKLR
jgi:hypothetical protein